MRTDSKEFLKTTAVVNGLALVTGGIAAFAIHVAKEDSPSKNFTRQYTEQGKCLDDTPYDPYNGAQLVVQHFKEADRLTVIPEAANSYSPSVLSFIVVGNTVQFADHQTGSFLVEAGCIDANSGQ